MNAYLFLNLQNMLGYCLYFLFIENKNVYVAITNKCDHFDFKVINFS